MGFIKLDAFMMFSAYEKHSRGGRFYPQFFSFYFLDIPDQTCLTSTVVLTFLLPLVLTF